MTGSATIYTAATLKSIELILPQFWFLDSDEGREPFCISFLNGDNFCILSKQANLLYCQCQCWVYVFTPSILLEPRKYSHRYIDVCVRKIKVTMTKILVINKVFGSSGKRVVMQGWIQDFEKVPPFQWRKTKKCCPCSATGILFMLDTSAVVQSMTVNKTVWNCLP